MVEKPSEEKKVDQEQEDIKKSTKKKFEKYEEEIEQLKAQVEHWKNEYYRAYADTKNLRTSLEKDHREALKYRSEGFIENLLPILDSFHVALGNEQTDPVLKNYLTGFNFIYRNIVQVLDDEGVKELTCKIGDKFDGNIMNAVDTVESEDEENVVARIYAKGYQLHDRLIRPINVSVTKHPAKAETDKADKNNKETNCA